MKKRQLDTRKAYQDTDVPSKLVKMNSDIFGDFLHQNFNDAIATSVFPENLKNTNITPVFKKGDGTVKLIIGLSAFFRTYLIFMKDVSINKLF